MKIARKWYQLFTVDRKPEEPDPELLERVLKVERELHSLTLELADLHDFTHRMAKRRYTENYDAVVAREPRSPKTGAPVPKIAGMTPEQKRELLRTIRGG